MSPAWKHRIKHLVVSVNQRPDPEIHWDLFFRRMRQSESASRWSSRGAKNSQRVLRFLVGTWVFKPSIFHPSGVKFLQLWCEILHLWCIPGFVFCSISWIMSGGFIPSLGHSKSVKLQHLPTPASQATDCGLFGLVLVTSPSNWSFSRSFVPTKPTK